MSLETTPLSFIWLPYNR